MTENIIGSYYNVNTSAPTPEPTNNRHYEEQQTLTESSHSNDPSSGSIRNKRKNEDYDEYEDEGSEDSFDENGDSFDEEPENYESEEEPEESVDDTVYGNDEEYKPNSVNFIDGEESSEAQTYNAERLSDESHLVGDLKVQSDYNQENYAPNQGDNMDSFMSFKQDFNEFGQSDNQFPTLGATNTDIVFGEMFSSPNGDGEILGFGVNNNSDIFGSFKIGSDGDSQFDMFKFGQQENDNFMTNPEFLNTALGVGTLGAGLGTGMAMGNTRNNEAPNTLSGFKTTSLKFGQAVSAIGGFLGKGARKISEINRKASEKNEDAMYEDMGDKYTFVDDDGHRIYKDDAGNEVDVDAKLSEISKKRRLAEEDRNKKEQERELRKKAFEQKVNDSEEKDEKKEDKKETREKEKHERKIEEMKREEKLIKAHIESGDEYVYARRRPRSAGNFLSDMFTTRRSSSSDIDDDDMGERIHPRTSIGSQTIGSSMEDTLGFGNMKGASDGANYLPKGGGQSQNDTLSMGTNMYGNKMENTLGLGGMSGTTMGDTIGVSNNGSYNQMGMSLSESLGIGESFGGGYGDGMQGFSLDETLGFGFNGGSIPRQAPISRVSECNRTNSNTNTQPTRKSSLKTPSPKVMGEKSKPKEHMHTPRVSQSLEERASRAPASKTPALAFKPDVPKVKRQKTSAVGDEFNSKQFNRFVKSNDEPSTVKKMNGRKTKSLKTKSSRTKSKTKKVANKKKR